MGGEEPETTPHNPYHQPGDGEPGGVGYKPSTVGSGTGSGQDVTGTSSQSISPLEGEDEDEDDDLVEKSWSRRRKCLRRLQTR